MTNPTDTLRDELKRLAFQNANKRFHPSDHESAGSYIDGWQDCSDAAVSHLSKPQPASEFPEAEFNAEMDRKFNNDESLDYLTFARWGWQRRGESVENELFNLKSELNQVKHLWRKDNERIAELTEKLADFDNEIEATDLLYQGANNHITKLKQRIRTLESAAEGLVKALELIATYRSWCGPSPDRAFQIARDALDAYKKQVGK